MTVTPVSSNKTIFYPATKHRAGDHIFIHSDFLELLRSAKTFCVQAGTRLVCPCSYEKNLHRLGYLT